MSDPTVNETGEAAATEGASERRIALRLRHVNKTFVSSKFGIPVVAIHDTSLDVVEGEFIVLLGPSGCGKTTLLRCIAGLEQPDSGEIEIFDRTVYSSESGTSVPPEHRGISMVFQTYALWPHMSVAKNVAYPLRYGQGEKYKPAEIAERVDRTLELVGIGGLGNRFPHQISGGQQQRVALARALVGGARVVLFDEPLSNVDAKVREQLRAEILQMQEAIGFTAFYVTHDQAEAMQLADRVAVIDHGKVIQLGPSREIYTAPTNRYTANFIGTTNEVEGQVVAIDETGVDVETPLGTVRSEAGHADDRFAIGQKVVATWRPERCLLHLEEPDATANAWSGEIRSNHFVGAHTEHIFTTKGVTLKQWSHVEDIRPGARVWLTVAPETVRVFPVSN